MYNNTNCPTKRGFTLVELSIALVIIGLLIAGILVGQSMIESAKLNKFVRQMQQLEIAVGTFRTKFKSMPGDSPYFSPAGNGDGNIFSTLSTIDRWDGELANFWVHMYQAQMMGDGKVYSTGADGLGRFLLCSTGSVSAPVAAFHFAKDVSPTTAGRGNCVGIFGFSAAGKYYFQTASNLSYAWYSNKILAGSAATCFDGQMIDTKMDDGLIASGSVIALQSRELTFNDAYGTLTAACHPGALTTNYNIHAFNSKSFFGGHGINLRFEMFSQGGQ